MPSKLQKRLAGYSDCSSKGIRKVKDLFKLVVNDAEIWNLAYNNIRTNKGAMTKGVDNTTADGHSEDRVLELMTQLRNGTWNPKPARRTYIPKSNGKLRPLGLPTFSDKLVQEVCKIILTAIYEPVFSKDSHGFRPKRSCHTALQPINKYWGATKWFIEFDIKGYFDNIDHDLLMQDLAEKIDDDRFLALIRKMLKAGYLEDWKYNKTYSGTPQGGVISPILSNIYLHKLDTFVGKLCEETRKGAKRKCNKEYRRLDMQTVRLKRRISVLDRDCPTRRTLLEELRKVTKEKENTRYGDPMDTEFRRLTYCRYADDFLLGYIGTKEEAEEVMAKIREFLKKERKLDCAEEKTKVAHHSKGVRFLNYDIRTTDRIEPIRKVINAEGKVAKQRITATQMFLFVPQDRCKDFVERHHYGSWGKEGKSLQRPYLLNNSEREIVTNYNGEVRGFCQYYKLAHNFNTGPLAQLYHIAQGSLIKTLANKFKTTQAKTYAKYRQSDRRLMIGNVKWFARKDVNREAPRSPETVDILKLFFPGRTELDQRQAARVCEYCGTEEGYFEVHHVNKLKDLKGREAWEQHMIARKRKTLVLCVPCHDLLHAGKLPSKRILSKAS